MKRNPPINPRPVCRQLKHDMTIEANVWIKPSTGQRLCRICRQEQRQRVKELNKDYFPSGKIWSLETLRIANTDQIRNHKLELNRLIDYYKKNLSKLESHNQDVIQEIVRRSGDNKPIRE